MDLKPSDLQLLADFLTGGKAITYALRESGALSVIAENGKKFLFSPDQVAWAQKQLQPSPKMPPKPATKPRAAKK